MTEILLCSLITSLFCLGFKISTGADMLLHKIQVQLDRVFITRIITKKRMKLEGKRKMVEVENVTVSKIYYPILYCIKCMPSIYGTAIALLLLPFHVELFYQIPLVIFCSVTLNCIFYQMYE